MFQKLGLILSWITAALTLNGIAIGFSILASIAVIVASFYKIRLDHQEYRINQKKQAEDPTKELPLIKSDL